MEFLNLSLRQRKILHFLQNRSSYVTSAELAGALKVSSRTIRNDIRDINDILSNCNACISSTNSKGFLFQAEDADLIRAKVNIDTAFFTSEERIRHLAIRLCDSDTPLNVYELEEEMFVSRTTLMADIRLLKKRYADYPPHIMLTVRGDEISYEKDELKIRSVLLNLFHEDWDYGSNRNAYFGHYFLDKKLLDLLMAKTSGILFNYGIIMEDTSLVALILSLAIMDYRFRKGHPFPDNLPAPNIATPFGMATKELFDIVEEHTGIAYPESEKARIYEFITHTYFSFDAWNSSVSDPGHFSPAARKELEKYMREIKDVFGIDFSEDREFMQSLLLFFQHLLSGNIIFYQHHDFRSIKEYMTAEYELAFLYQKFAPDYIGRYLIENELCNLVICFSGAFRYYLSLHPEKQLKAALFSHRTRAAAWGLKRQILESLHLFLDIVDILPLNFLEHYDFSEIDLAFVTSKKGEKYRDSRAEKILYIDDQPSVDFGKYSSEIKMRTLKNIWPAPPFSLKELLENAYWYEEEEFTESRQVINKLASRYIMDDIASPSHISDISHRERQVSFAIKPGLVFLHTIIPAKETKLAVMTLKHRVKWNDIKISTAVMAMFRKEDLNLLFQLKIQFCNHSFDEELLFRSRKKDQLIPIIS